MQCSQKLTERVMRRKAQYIRNNSFFIRNINTYQYIPIEKQIGLHSVKLNDIKLREFILNYVFFHLFLHITVKGIIIRHFFK